MSDFEKWPIDPVLERLLYYNKSLSFNLFKKTFENFENSPSTEEAFSFLKNYRLDCGIGVWIEGAPGVGKTHLMISALREIAWRVFYGGGGKLSNEKGIPKISFWNYSDLCMLLRENRDFVFLDRIRRSEFLFIDDVGINKSSEFIQEKMYSILNFRVENSLPTFFSTNLSSKEVTEEFSERFSSRILENCVYLKLNNSVDFRSKIYINRKKK